MYPSLGKKWYNPGVIICVQENGGEGLGRRGGGWLVGTPFNGLYGEAPPERGTFFKLPVDERVGISPVELYEKSVILVCKKA